MENTNWDTAAIAAPQYDWQHPETKESYTSDFNHHISDDEEELSIYAMTPHDDPEKEEESDDANEETGDWGHVDPAEGTSLFSSSTDPSGPGSAV